MENKENQQSEVTVCMEVAGAESIDFVDVQPQTVKSK